MTDNGLGVTRRARGRYDKLAWSGRRDGLPNQMSCSESRLTPLMGADGATSAPRID